MILGRRTGQNVIWLVPVFAAVSGEALAVCLPPADPTATTCVYSPDVFNESLLDRTFSLREAIDLANADELPSVVALEPGQTYSLTFCALADDNENARGDLDHFDDNDLTITGDATFIRQSCNDRRLLEHLTTVGTVRFEGVTLTGGGDIANLPDGTLRSVGNTEFVGGGVLGSRGTGIYLDGSADDRPLLSMTGAAVSLNDGSGIDLLSADANLDDVNIELNGGAGIGGVGGNTIVVTNSRIRSNTFGGVSGGLVEVSGSDISGNGRTGITGLEISVTSSEVSDNDEGGILCTPCRSLGIDTVLIERNGIDGAQAGGIRVLGVLSGGSADDPWVSINQGQISDNETVAPANTTDGGAGVLIDPQTDPLSGPVLIVESIIGRNQALPGNGGGIATRRVPVSIRDSAVGFNLTSSQEPVFGDGGGISHVGPGPLTITGSLIYANEADGDGGAIRVVNSTGLTITDTDMFSNSSPGSGGGINTLNVGIVEIADSIVASNRAVTPGGGIFMSRDGDELDQSVLAVERSFIGFNGASAGAGISTEGIIRMDLENTTIFFNIAQNSTTSGSAIRSLDISAVEIDYSTITGNQNQNVPQIFVGSLGSLSLRGSVVDGSNPACDAVLPSSGGDNVVRDGSCVVGSGGTTGPNDVVLNAPVGLNLADYVGDPRPVLVPNAASPVVGHIRPGECDVALDGRDVPRPQPLGGRCDAGAAERIDGGISGPAPVLVLGPPPEEEEAVLERLASVLGPDAIVPIEVAATDVFALARAVRDAAFIFLSPEIDDEVLLDIATGSPAAILSWNAASFVNLGLAGRAEETQQPLYFEGRPTKPTTRPRKLAVCEPGRDGDMLVRFTAKRKGALCVYEPGSRLVGDRRAPGRRVAVAFDPGSATEAGWKVFDMAIEAAFKNPERTSSRL